MKGKIVKDRQNYFCVGYDEELFCSEEECDKWELTYQEYSKVLERNHAKIYEYKGQGDYMIHDHYFDNEWDATNALHELYRFCAYKEVAKSLGKSEWLLVKGNSKEKYLLVGSPLAFDEIIEEKVMILIHSLVENFGGDDKTYDYDSDKVATLRDDYIREFVIAGLEVTDVIYGTIEF